MIPIRDTVPSKNYPIVNFTLIGINIAVFLIQMSLGARGQDQFIYTYGLVPARFSVPYISSHFTLSQQLFSLISFMFLHGGFFHILGNMWFLYIFGDNVEDRLGSFYYLIFYLLCGFASGIFHLLLNFQSAVPTIGASGAIAGVMGAYIVLYPRSKILTLIPIIIIPWFIEIPAFFFLGFWFFIQLLNAAFTSGLSGGIAWYAHIGGFLFGVVSLKFFNVLPESGVAGNLKSVAMKRKTSPRFQMLKTAATGRDQNIYYEINVTPYEAAAGVTKTINIPWGFYNRFYRVNIPPGAHDGMVLRLRGAVRQTDDGGQGDVLLKLKIQQPW